MKRVRELLNRDRVWCIYALGDLDPRRARHCEWFVRGESVALLYREFDTPILFASGEPDILDEVPVAALASCYFQVPWIEPIEARVTLAWKRSMNRMSLAREDFRPVADSAHPLTVDDESAIRALYANGAATHEEPDFFMRNQLLDNTFRGVFADGELVAAGGTHLYSDAESIGPIGNVYTHRDHRGKGYGTQVTGAIASDLIARGIETIALNVKSRNAAAISIYRRLGFRLHTSYWEAYAGA